MLALPVLVGITCTALASGIYRWTDDQGNVHFGDRPPVDTQAEEMEIRVNSVAGPPVIEQLERFLDNKPDRPETGTREDVVIFTTKRCGYCKRARAYFEANDIPYTEYDVEESAEAREEFRRLGGQGVPLILVNNRVLRGFSEEAFERVYAAL